MKNKQKFFKCPLCQESMKLLPDLVGDMHECENRKCVLEGLPLFTEAVEALRDKIEGIARQAFAVGRYLTASCKTFEQHWGDRGK